jgi:hypothetical protein
VKSLATLRHFNKPLVRRETEMHRERSHSVNFKELAVPATPTVMELHVNVATVVCHAEKYKAQQK